MDPTQPPTLSSPSSPSSTPSDAAPPAYSMVVDPGRHDDEQEELPEVTINAPTRVQGHANVVNVAPLDSRVIVGMINTLIQNNNAAAFAPTVAGPVTAPASASRLNLHITINCGTTILGDRNIIGPTLGDVARYMQRAKEAGQSPGKKTGPEQGQGEPAVQQAGHQVIQGQPQQVASVATDPVTPPRSRSASESEADAGVSAGVKRKAEDDSDQEEREGKRTC